MNRIAPVLLTLALVPLFGCDEKQPEPRPTSPATASPDAPAPQPAAQPAGQPASPSEAQAIGWTKPEAWKELTEKKPMRLTTYEVAAVEGDTEGAEVSVSQAMGSAEANIKRWEGQFGGAQAKTEDKEIAGLKVTVVEIEGAMMAGGGPMMGGGGTSKEGFKMVAAMVHTTPSAYFFKMWGPKKTVDAARGDFDALIGGIGKK